MRLYKRFSRRHKSLKADVRVYVVYVWASDIYYIHSTDVFRNPWNCCLVISRLDTHTQESRLDFKWLPSWQRILVWQQAWEMVRFCSRVCWGILYVTKDCSWLQGVYWLVTWVQKQKVKSTNQCFPWKGDRQLPSLMNSAFYSWREPDSRQVTFMCLSCSISVERALEIKATWDLYQHPKMSTSLEKQLLWAGVLQVTWKLQRLILIHLRIFDT